jgi:hypothetical protein
MKRHAFVAARFGAVIALGLLGLLGFACSSSTTTGTGGSTGGGGTTGTGGSSTGTGGHGTGGLSGGQGGSGVGGMIVLPACTTPAPEDGAPCNSNPTCTKDCGVDITVLTPSKSKKTCTCSGANGTWSCPNANKACVYPTDALLDCLVIPTGITACPADTTDGGSGLIRTGVSTCPVPNSEVCGNICGSTTANTYRDSAGAAHAGYCVCTGKWQCATVADWYYP